MRMSLLFLMIATLFQLFPETAGANSSQRAKQTKIKNISDLKNLTPFENISILQRRYLPKTFRGELNLALSSIMNNQFFYLGGGAGHLGFFVREDHGFGIEGYGMFHKGKLVSSEFVGGPNRIIPYNLIVSQFYGGGYYKWSPIFGKFAVFNKKIIYFDMFFTVGGGMTKTISGITPELKHLMKVDEEPPEPAQEWFPTGSLGLGQVFTINQSFGWDWHLKWFFYFYNLSHSTEKFFHSDLNFSIGINYYFPGASYR